MLQAVSTARDTQRQLAALRSHVLELTQQAQQLQLQEEVVVTRVRGEAALARWEDGIRRARSLEGDSLIPPMDVIKCSGLTAIVMPRGKQVAQSCGRTIDAMLLETSRTLGKAGLFLDDYPQVREALGVPFIIDWSDLTTISNSPG